MRDLHRASALAFAFTLVAGIANAQESGQQVSPQNGQSPSSVDERANEAARQRLKEYPRASGAGVDDARGGQGNPTPDQVVGPPNAGPVALRGDGLDLPGASPQTAPAKFSAENAQRLEYSIMGYPVQLSDEQKRAIWNAVGDKGATANETIEKIHAEAGVFLPPAVEAEAFPEKLSAKIPEVQGLKFVKADGKILLIAPSNGIVRGVVEE